MSDRWSHVRIGLLVAIALRPPSCGDSAIEITDVEAFVTGVWRMSPNGEPRRARRCPFLASLAAWVRAQHATGRLTGRDWDSRWITPRKSRRSGRFPFPRPFARLDHMVA